MNKVLGGSKYFEGSKKIGCICKGWSGKDCASTQRIYMLVEGAEAFTE